MTTFFEVAGECGSKAREGRVALPYGGELVVEENEYGVLVFSGYLAAPTAEFAVAFVEALFGEEGTFIHGCGESEMWGEPTVRDGFAAYGRMVGPLTLSCSRENAGVRGLIVEALNQWGR